MAKKKVSRKKKSVKNEMVMKKDSSEVSCSVCGNGGCHCYLWLCSFSTVFFVFALIGLLPQLGTFVMDVHWAIWLLVSLILGYKPLKSCFKK